MVFLGNMSRRIFVFLPSYISQKRRRALQLSRSRTRFRFCRFYLCSISARTFPKIPWVIQLFLEEYSAPSISGEFEGPIIMGNQEKYRTPIFFRIPHCLLMRTWSHKYVFQSKFPFVLRRNIQLSFHETLGLHNGFSC